MMEQGVGAILVKKDSIPAGIITDRDFAIKVAANKCSLDTTVDKIASYPLKTISPDEPIFKAAETMSSLKIRKLVVQENDKIVGIITSTDVVRLVATSKN
jgi:signal-transduction protein with cAMP-binding, CBS, and nucleotidyltransferase domain